MGLKARVAAWNQGFPTILVTQHLKANGRMVSARYGEHACGFAIFVTLGHQFSVTDCPVVTDSKL